MWRLCKAVTGAAVLTTLALGCGSTGEDNLVMRFIGFNADGITQEDTASPTSADVDVVQDVCSVSEQGVPTFEPFTATTINAVFRNEEAANIHLKTYTVHFNDPNSGVADVTASLVGNPDLLGGRCSSSGTQCAVSTDCVSVGGGGGGTGAQEDTCTHTDSTVDGIVLVDFAAKEHVNPEIFGQATSLTVTFVGKDDANRTFEVTAGYVVIFGDFNNCATTTGGGAGGS